LGEPPAGKLLVDPDVDEPVELAFVVEREIAA
jgi:hypothetical protein